MFLFGRKGEIEMDANKFIELCKKAVVDYFNEHADKTSELKICEADVFVVWYCKTLQNSKALLSTTVSDGMYYELTFNGDKNELYFDAYKKWENKCIKKAAPKKKAMISQPMNGLTDEEIEETRNRAITHLESLGYEVVNTLFTDEWYSSENMEKRGVRNIPLCFMAKSIENMCLCDAVYFCRGWENARGCRIEHECAKAYGLQIIYEESAEESAEEGNSTISIANYGTSTITL